MKSNTNRVSGQALPKDFVKGFPDGRTIDRNTRKKK
jgi:hypothetical protein